MLDLFSGAGGSARGYQQAGFYVIGVDLQPQPRYAGDEFVQADALEFAAAFDWTTVDAIHASPPCQHYANVTSWRGDTADHPDLLPATLAMLSGLSLPWVVENVPEAPVRPDLLLCGSQFGLKVRRHRAFQTSPRLYSLVPPCAHRGLLPFEHKQERAYADAMGCTWMTNVDAREHGPRRRMPGVRLLQRDRYPLLLNRVRCQLRRARRRNGRAIPPSYTHHIGELLLAAIREGVPQ